ncbi:methyltransferase family protein [Salsuginibacillus halophilus]|uniref:Methyltransferase family protein n=1 Tax=Salsuginibacillus halophilus TaxID=517424 RepID=A0A2P8H3R5_9BACI|nr:class I SAM-dependent methyltransferase [Salsuginibacillus halophilus]PSL40858.1 methyltransferase family protein [Salsuginibacillus halophilus]
MTNHHRFPPERAEALINEERRQLLPTDRVMAWMAPDQSMTAVDIGCGNGYLTLPLAERVQEVFAVDVAEEMLDKLMVRAGEAHINNIEAVQSDMENLQLKDHTADQILVAFVAHEIPNLYEALLEAKRVLKPEGTLFLAEWEPVETSFGPPVAERMAASAVQHVLEQAGFKVEETSLNEANYGLKATKT